MELITLSKFDYQKVRPVALRLAEFWRADPYAANASFEGLFAEYAVIKFLNYALGASPAIVFNNEYRDGGDGGFDFRFVNLRWDVKSTSTERLESRFVRRSKADCIVGVNRCDHSVYEIWGFLPRGRVPERETLTQDDFRPLALLKRAFPESFPRSSQPAEASHPEQAGDIADVLVRSLVIRSGYTQKGAQHESI